MQKKLLNFFVAIFIFNLFVNDILYAINLPAQPGLNFVVNNPAEWANTNKYNAIADWRDTWDAYDAAKLGGFAIGSPGWKMKALAVLDQSPEFSETTRIFCANGPGEMYLLDPSSGATLWGPEGGIGRPSLDIGVDGCHGAVNADANAYFKTYGGSWVGFLYGAMYISVGDKNNIYASFDQNGHIMKYQTGAGHSNGQVVDTGITTAGGQSFAAGTDGTLWFTPDNKTLKIRKPGTSQDVVLQIPPQIKRINSISAKGTAGSYYMILATQDNDNSQFHAYIRDLDGSWYKINVNKIGPVAIGIQGTVSFSLIPNEPKDTVNGSSILTAPKAVWKSKLAQVFTESPLVALDPFGSKNPNPASADVLVKDIAAEKAKADAEKAVADKAVADKVAADKVAADKAKADADKIAADKAKADAEEAARVTKWGADVKALETAGAADLITFAADLTDTVLNLINGAAQSAEKQNKYIEEFKSLMASINKGYATLTKPEDQAKFLDGFVAARQANKDANANPQFLLENADWKFLTEALTKLNTTRSEAEKIAAQKAATEKAAKDWANGWPAKLVDLNTKTVDFVNQAIMLGAGCLTNSSANLLPELSSVVTVKFATLNLDEMGTMLAGLQAPTVDKNLADNSDWKALVVTLVAKQTDAQKVQDKAMADKTAAEQAQAAASKAARNALRSGSFEISTQ